jgi:hypothetical protein
MAKDSDQYSDKEAKDRFEAALRGALNTPRKPLKEKPKVEKAAKKRRGQNYRTLYHLLRLNMIDDTLDNRRIDTQQRGNSHHADAVAVGIQRLDLGFDGWRDRPAPRLRV